MRPNLFPTPRLDVLGDETPVTTIELKNGLHKEFMFGLGPGFTCATNCRVLIMSVVFTHPPRHRGVRIFGIFEIWGKGNHLKALVVIGVAANFVF